MIDIVMRMKTLPDLTNEKAWETVYEGASEIERLRAEIDRLKGIYRSAGDAAYGDYIAILSRDVCKGVEHKMQHGKFGAEELRCHNSASELLGKHRACVAFVCALQGMQQTSMSTEELIALHDEISLSQI